MKPNSTASCASAASVSSMKSPSWASSSSPTVWSRLTRSRAVLQELGDAVRGDVQLRGPAPPRWRPGRAAGASRRRVRSSLLTCSTRWTGSRMVRPWSAIAAGDRLPDPPGRVRRELEALGVVELLHRADQAEVALLDQVQERQPVAGVALGQRDDQPQVGLQQVLLGPAAVGRQRLQVPALGRGELLAGVGEQVVGVEAGLDPLGQLDLLLGVEQGDLADLVEVDPDQVGGQRRGLLVQVGQDLVVRGGRVGTGRVRPHRWPLRTVRPRHDARLHRRAAARRGRIGARKRHGTDSRVGCGATAMFNVS